MTPPSAGRPARSAAGTGRPHDTRTPDVETASDAYAARFAGTTGAFLLAVQTELALAMLRSAAGSRSLRVLDVGGGHGQLCHALAAAGPRVFVHGSRPVCHARNRAAAAPGIRGEVVSGLWSLPVRDRGFDLVTGIRLLAHVERWEELLCEMARPSAEFLLLDFPPRGGFNRLAPALFSAKRGIEGNTRPFFTYRTAEVARTLADAGFAVRELRRELALPMVLHRRLGSPALSRSLEAALGRAGLTRRFGAPALLLAERVSS